jgi:dihydropteroate synthase
MNAFHPDLGQRTLIMGILNVTPDSFSDGGEYTLIERAVKHARRLIAEGADMLDIGGESTRPRSLPVSEEEELERVIPVLAALREDGCPVPISIDTYKGSVAREALQSGASIINDVWGGRKDPEILRVAVEREAPIILMHNRTNLDYGPDVIETVIDDLRVCVERALEAGIPKDRIALDPGIGFAKQRGHNLLLMNGLGDLVRLGYPVLLGTSRKRFIQETLEARPDDVVEGTIATTVLGIAQGVQMLRVHDVRANVKAARMTDAIIAARYTQGG